MSTRSHRKTQVTPVKSLPNKRVENSWILLAKNSLIENSSFCIITLPHPGHGKPAKYCLDDLNKKIYEIVSFSEPHRSWFIEETVKSDGCVQLITPINPVFIVLPRLKELCNSRALPLEDLLSEKGFNKITDYISDLDSIADLKGPPDLKAYKYNEDKTLSWLEEKVNKLAKILRLKNISVTSGAVSATFVTSNINNDGIDEEFFLKYAYGMIAEYLQDDLGTKLEQRFSFKPELIESVGKKRKSEITESRDSKKIKCDNSMVQENDNFVEFPENKVEVKKQKPLTAKEKARQKAATGTKTISAFFTKQ